MFQYVSASRTCRRQRQHRSMVALEALSDGLSVPAQTSKSPILALGFDVVAWIERRSKLSLFPASLCSDV
jgi:hypothetical protein